MTITHERRKARRREILDFLSFYIHVPKLGPSRHQVHDVSENGIGFIVETLGVYKLEEGEVCDLNLYLNQSLFLPLKIRVIRQDAHEKTQTVGAIFLDKETNQYKTFLSLVNFLDQLAEFASE